MKWDDFEREAPALAAAGRARLASAGGLVMLGTLRKNGWPRITPIEHSFFDGDLTIGGMWGSQKMLDLLRDGRCVIHSITTDPNATQGDFKLYGRAVSIDDQARRDRSAQATYDTVGFLPEEPYHLFAIDITEAAFVAFFDEEGATAKRLAGDGRVRLAGTDNPDYPASFLTATWKAEGTPLAG